MSFPDTRSFDTCAAHNRRIDEIMPLERWKAIKGVFFAIVTLAFAAFVISANGEPTAVFFGAMTLLFIYYGVELHEVELVKGITITFKNGHDDGDQDSDEDEA